METLRYRSITLCAALICIAGAPALAETAAFAPGTQTSKPSNDSLAGMRGKMISRVLIQVGDQVFSDTDVGYPSSAHVVGSVGTTSAGTTFAGHSTTGPASFTRSYSRPSLSTGGSFSNTIRARGRN